MTSEEYIKQKYPLAVVQRFKKNNSDVYYLCYTKPFNGERLGEGKTKSKAWVNAKRNIEKNYE
tara:strand:+ start:217 stop:405 length:189 start_codon:yes stop_codon:yes gene_type:complete